MQSVASGKTTDCKHSDEVFGPAYWKPSCFPCRGRKKLKIVQKIAPTVVSIHAPRGGTSSCLTACCGITDFNPRTPWGVRRVFDFVSGVKYKFQSTHPVGGATPGCGRVMWSSSDFNPRTPWGVRLKSCWYGFAEESISIHAPRGGCDLSDRRFLLLGHISIHAPRGGCDVAQTRRIWSPILFQSTHPVGGATQFEIPENGTHEFQSTHPVGGVTYRPDKPHPYPGYFNPRTPWGVRRMTPTTAEQFFSISIHAPRGGCD